MLFFKRKISKLSDEELLIHYTKSGDTEYFGELYNRYIPLLYGLCLKYLTQEEVENKTASGKVGFAVNYNGKPAAEVEAITNALQSYEDGIFRIFMDDTETGDLSSPIQLKEESTLTFIRLAMLSGRLW